MIESTEVSRVIVMGISVETQAQTHAPTRSASFEYRLKDADWHLLRCFDSFSPTTDAGTPSWVKTVIEDKLPHSVTADSTEIVIIARPDERKTRMLCSYTSGMTGLPHGARISRTSSSFARNHAITEISVLGANRSVEKSFKIHDWQFEEVARRLNVTIPGLPKKRPAFTVL